MDRRISTCIEAEFEAGGRRASGTIKNVGEGGLFVRTTSIPEEGDSLDLSFSLPGTGELNLSGLVWWTNSNGERGRPGFALRVFDDSTELRELLASQ